MQPVQQQLSSSSSINSSASSSCNAPHMVRHCRRQVTPCGPQRAAAVNPITATRSVDAANHQPLTQQQLLDLGATFVRCWFAGIAKGPQAVEESLSSILDSNVLLVADRVRQLQDQQVGRVQMLMPGIPWTCSDFKLPTTACGYSCRTPPVFQLRQQCKLDHQKSGTEEV